MRGLFKFFDIRVLFLFVLWINILFITAFIAPLIIADFGAKFPYFRETLMSSGLHHYIWQFGNFDGVHYLRIARDGYSYQYTQAFFPLYPILIRAVSYITQNYLLSAVLISNISFFLALVIFFQLVKENYNQKTALWACAFLLAFPTSFYFASVYTEGLFTLMVVSSFYLLNKGRPWLASLIGAFSSATKLIGVFLAIAFFFERKIDSSGLKAGVLSSSLGIKSKIPYLTIPLGLIFYSIYLKIRFDNPLYFLTSQSNFGQERLNHGIVLLPQVIYRYIKIILTTDGSHLIIPAFELVSTLGAFAILLIGAGRIKREWLVFSLIAVILPTLTGTLVSMPRYILAAFPIFIILGMIKSSLMKIIILLFFGAGLLFATLFFTRGYWIA